MEETSPYNRDNAGKFAPGGAGGPGRGKAPRHIERILNRIGDEEIVTEDGVVKTRREVMLRMVYGLAEEGTQWAVQFIAERTEGKVKESTPVVESDLVPTEGLVFSEEKQEANAG